MLKQKYCMQNQISMICMCIAHQKKKILNEEMIPYEENCEQARYTPQLLLGLIQRLYMSIVKLAGFEDLDMNRLHSRLAF